MAAPQAPQPVGCGRGAASRAVRASPAVGCGGVPQPAGLAPPRLGRTPASAQARAGHGEAPAGVPDSGACSGLAATTTRTGWTQQGAPVEGTPSRAGAHGHQACAAWGHRGPGPGRRAAPRCRFLVPPLAPRPLLCYPYIHPGPAALMTIRAPSVGRRTPPTGLHPKRPWGQDRGCLVRETSPSGSTDTRTGPGQDGRVRPPPALGGPGEITYTSRSSTKGSPAWQRSRPRCLCPRPRAHRPGRA